MNWQPPDPPEYGSCPNCKTSIHESELRGDRCIECEHMIMINIDKAAESIAQMVTEWVDDGIKMGTNWRPGLDSIIARRLTRFADPAERGADDCDVPPAGWSCSRQKGHEGPCAASPLDESQHRYGEAAEMVTLPRKLLELSVNGFEQEQGRARNELRELLGAPVLDTPMPTDTALRRAGLFLSGMDERYTHCNEMKTLRSLINIAQNHSDMLNVKPKAHCRNGDACLCGGDTEGVRATCSNWIKE